MKKIQYFISLLIGLHLFGQSTLSISGKVINQKTNDPLPFATVSVEGTGHGTISNSKGEFEFFFPSSLMKDTLSISYVGFETYKLVIRQIKSPLKVSLKERIIILDEVEVNAEQLTANQIIDRALDKLKDNFHTRPVILKGIFRDIRSQNGETVSLTEAALDVQDAVITSSRKFFIRGLRASQSRVDPLLRSSLLNSGNALTVNMGTHFWLNSLRHRIRKLELEIEDIIYKNDELFYIITSNEVVSKGDLDEEYKNLKYELIHRYLIHSETYAIHKVEHLENAIEGKYVGIEPPYEGDTLFYCKKGWNQVVEFEEYQGKMHIKYHDVNYAFDILDKKNNEVYLDMAYQFIFTTTEIVTDKSQKPEGIKMSKRDPLSLQAKGYDKEFWEDPGNVKLVPLTQKQIKDLERHQPLEEQFRSKKNRPNKHTN